MRKNKLVVGLVALLTAAMLTACGGSSKEDYKADIDSLNEMMKAVATIEDVEDYEKALDKLEMKTDEGDAIKKDMEDFGKLLGEMSEMMEDLENYDEEKAEKLEKDMEEIQERMEDDSDAFEEAARKKGLKDEDLEKIEEGL